jgi:hypothetical protein
MATTLQCPVCHEDFNTTDYKPFVSSRCGHSFCQKCINKIGENCPVCREFCHGYVKNYSLIEILESVPSMEVLSAEAKKISDMLAKAAHNLIENEERKKMRETVLKKVKEKVDREVQLIRESTSKEQERLKKVKEEADREARLIMKYRAEVQGIREIIGDLISRRNELQRTVKSLEALPKASVYIPPYRRK